jgi:hypothetical protein
MKIDYKEIIGSEFRKDVLKVLEESNAVQSSVNEKRHKRLWYQRFGTSSTKYSASSFGELSTANEKFITFLLQSKFSVDLKNEVFIDYNGGNGVLCLYLNKLGYDTYFWDWDSKEADNLLSYFDFEDKIIDKRSNIFKWNPPITVAVACGCSLNDNLGIPLTEIKSLKYMFLDSYGLKGGADWCYATDVSNFKRIDSGNKFKLYKKS